MPSLIWEAPRERRATRVAAVKGNSSVSRAGVDNAHKSRARRLSMPHRDARLEGCPPAARCDLAGRCWHAARPHARDWGSSSLGGGGMQDLAKLSNSFSMSAAQRMKE
mmetsp:Transcript_32927/g.78137  ORF Transcript_32927/g.78137 Transcript_32927/m.78137 type:complete len:108 (-) Transcript_32927:7056-7379(-)